MSDHIKTSSRVDALLKRANERRKKEQKVQEEYFTKLLPVLDIMGNVVSEGYEKLEKEEESSKQKRSLVQNVMKRAGIQNYPESLQVEGEKPKTLGELRLKEDLSQQAADEERARQEELAGKQLIMRQNARNLFARDELPVVEEGQPQPLDVYTRKIAEMTGEEPLFGLKPSEKTITEKIIDKNWLDKVKPDIDARYSLYGINPKDIEKRANTQGVNYDIAAESLLQETLTDLRKLPDIVIDPREYLDDIKKGDYKSVADKLFTSQFNALRYTSSSVVGIVKSMYDAVTMTIDPEGLAMKWASPIGYARQLTKWIMPDTYEKTEQDKTYKYISDKLTQSREWLQEKVVDAIAPDADKYRVGTVGKVASGVGSTFGFVASMLLTKGLNLGKYAPAVVGAMTQSGSMSYDVYKRTGDLDKAWVAFLAAIPLGATEQFGIGKLLGNLDKLSKGPFKQLMAEMFRETLEEIPQEFGQSYGEAVTYNKLTGDNRNAWQEAYENALIAGLSVPITVGLIGGGSKIKAKFYDKIHQQIAADRVREYYEKIKEAMPVSVEKELLDMTPPLTTDEKEEIYKELDEGINRVKNLTPVATTEEEVPSAEDELGVGEKKEVTKQVTKIKKTEIKSLQERELETETPAIEAGDKQTREEWIKNIPDSEENKSFYTSKPKYFKITTKSIEGFQTGSREVIAKKIKVKIPKGSVIFQLTEDIIKTGAGETVKYTDTDAVLKDYPELKTEIATGDKSPSQLKKKEKNAEIKEHELKTSDSKGVINTPRVTTKYSSDLTEIETLSSKFNGKNKVKLSATVNNTVLRLINNPEIRKAIIPFIPINVVDQLMPGKFTTEKFLDNPSMFKDLLATVPNSEVRSSILRPIIDALARVRTEFDKSSAGGEEELTSTDIADMLNLISRQPITETSLGTESSVPGGLINETSATQLTKKGISHEPKIQNEKRKINPVPVIEGESIEGQPKGQTKKRVTQRGGKDEEGARKTLPEEGKGDEQKEDDDVKATKLPYAPIEKLGPYDIQPGLKTRLNNLRAEAAKYDAELKQFEGKKKLSSDDKYRKELLQSKRKDAQNSVQAIVDEAGEPPIKELVDKSRKVAREKDVPLKEQKNNIVDQVQDALDVVLGDKKTEYTRLIKDTPMKPDEIYRQVVSEIGGKDEAIRRLQKAGIKLVDDGTFIKAVFNIKGDGTYRISIDTLDITLDKIKKEFPVSLKPSTIGLKRGASLTKEERAKIEAFVKAGFESGVDYEGEKFSESEKTAIDKIEAAAQNVYDELYAENEEVSMLTWEDQIKKRTKADLTNLKPFMADLFDRMVIPREEEKAKTERTGRTEEKTKADEKPGTTSLIDKNAQELTEVQIESAIDEAKGRGAKPYTAEEIEKARTKGNTQNKIQFEKLKQEIDNKNFKVLNDKLHTKNKYFRKFFAEYTGIKLPKTEGGTTDALKEFTGFTETAVKPAEKTVYDKYKDTLNRKFVYGDLGEMTRQQFIDKQISEGGKVEEFQRRSASAEERLKKEVELLRRNAPLGNPNHPDSIKYYEANDRLRAGIFTTNYRVVDKEGHLWDATKGEFEYFKEQKQKPTKVKTNVSPTQKGEVAAKDVEKIEDYGEKIGGAKKDLIKQLNDVTTEDIANQPLSKSFPEPDYKSLVDNKTITVEGAMLLKYLYQNIPAKPRREFKLKRWVEKVQDVIKAVKGVIEGNKTKELNYLEEMKNRPNYEWLAKDYHRYTAILKAIGFPENDIKLGVYDVHKDYSSGNWYVVKGRRILSRDFKTIEEAAKSLKEILDSNKGKTVEVKFDLYKDQKTGEFFIGKKGAAGIVRVMKGFKTSIEASNFYKENKPELQKIWEGMKLNPEERRPVNRERVGVDWRKGEKITSEKFANTFGFRGVEFGNWENQTDRQDNINDAYDALMDLSAAIGVSPKALSLNGELGFAFGARGSGRASAHYEPGKVVINLTKTRGAGSLAHEWWHAIDNYFERVRGEKSSHFITESPRQRMLKSGEMDMSIRVEMINAFKAVVDSIKKSALPGRSKQLDQTRSKPYWSTIIEMSARSFENFIINKLAAVNEQNDYLANFKETGEWIGQVGLDLDNYPYPLKDESPAIDEAFQKFFDTVQEKVSEEGKTVMFQKGEAEEFNVNGRVGDKIAAIVNKVKNADTDKQAILDVLTKKRDSVTLKTKKGNFTLYPGNERGGLVHIIKEHWGVDINTNDLFKIAHYINMGERIAGNVNHANDYFEWNNPQDGLRYRVVIDQDDRVVTLFTDLTKKNRKAVTLTQRSGRAPFGGSVTNISNETAVVNSKAADAMIRAGMKKMNRLFERLGYKIEEVDGDEMMDKLRRLEEEGRIGKGMFSRNSLPMGLYEGKTIVLNTEGWDASTPVHEGGHLWNAVVHARFPGLWAIGKKIVDDYLQTEAGKEFLSELQKQYPELSGDALYDEILAQMIGKQGAMIIQEEDANKPRTIKARFEAWLKRVWEKISGYFNERGFESKLGKLNLQTATLEEFSNAIAADLLKGDPAVFEFRSLQAAEDLGITDLIDSALITGRTAQFKVNGQYYAISGLENYAKKHNINLDEVKVGDKLPDFGKVEEVFGDKEYNTIHRLDLTPEMAESVLYGGQAMFQKQAKGKSEKAKIEAVTDTPAFKKGFGDSKVVDENGKPLVVYHGTSKNFDIFKDKFKNKGTGVHGELGYFFTSNPELASDFTRKDWIRLNSQFKKNAQILPVYLSLKNPYYLTARKFTQLGDDISLRDDINFKKHDGIIITPFTKEDTESWERLFNDGSSKEFQEPQYVVFKSNQIKSATGNRGTFDAGNADIRFQKRPVVPEDLPETVRKKFEATRKKKQIRVKKNGTVSDENFDENMDRLSALGAKMYASGQTKAEFKNMMREAFKTATKKPFAITDEQNEKLYNESVKLKEKLKAGTIKERRFTQQVLTSENVAEEIKEDVSEIYYNTISNPQTLEDAQKLIDEAGPDGVLAEIRDEMSEVPGRVRVAAGEILIKQLSKNGDELKAKDDKAGMAVEYEKAINIADELAVMGTRMGQTVQAYAIFRKLTPSGAVYYAQKYIRKMNKERIKKAEEKQGFVKRAIDAINKRVTDRLMRKEWKSFAGEVREILEKHFTQAGEEADLRQKLIKAGLNENEADKIMGQALAQFAEIATAQKKLALDKYFKKPLKIIESKKQKQLYEKIIELSNLGALTDDKYKKLFAERYNIKKLTPEQAEEITRMAEEIQKTPEGFQQNEKIVDMLSYIRNINGMELSEIGYAIFYANILSGVSTQLKNSGNNILNMTLELFNRNPAEYPKAIQGLFKGFRKGWYEARAILEKGDKSNVVSKFEVSNILERWQMQKGGNLNPVNLLRFWRYVGRFLAAQDRLLYWPSNEAESRAIARNIAKKQGLSGKALTAEVEKILNDSDERISAARMQTETEGLTGRDKERRIYEIISLDRPEEITNEADKYAAYATYNYDPRGVLGAIASAIGHLTNTRGFRAGKFIVPFTRIVANVSNNMIDYTPWGYKRAFAGYGFTGSDKLTPRERNRMIGRATFGTLAAFALYAMAGGGDDDKGFEITAEGTGDFEKNRQLMETGWRPYSFRFNGRWYEYKYLTALFIPFAVVGYIRDAERYKKDWAEKEWSEKVSATVFLGIRAVTDMSFLSGLSELMGIFDRSDPTKAENYIKRFVANTGSSFVVPNIVKQMSKIWMPQQYEANSFWELLLRSSVVGLSLSDAKPKINVLGEPVMYDPNSVFVFAGTKETDKRIWHLIAKNNAWISVPNKNTVIYDSKTSEDRAMTPDEYYEYIRISGDFVKRTIEANIDDFEKLGTEEVRDNLKKIVDLARETAKKQISGINSTYKYDFNIESLRIKLNNRLEKAGLDKRHISTSDIKELKQFEQNFDKMVNLYKATDKYNKIFEEAGLVQSDGKQYRYRISKEEQYSGKINKKRALALLKGGRIDGGKYEENGKVKKSKDHEVEGKLKSLKDDKKDGKITQEEYEKQRAAVKKAIEMLKAP